MWISRKELKDLQARVEKLYKFAEESGDRALLRSDGDEAKRFQDLLWSHLDLRVSLAGLMGKLEAMATRSWW